MDYIIKPCDWETVDLKTEQDPNKFGEALRGYCFVGNCMERGCYSTFKLLERFEAVNYGKIYDEAKKYIFNQYQELEDLPLHVFKLELKEEDCYIENAKYKIAEPFEIICAWSWDGDGCLYFCWNDRAVINNDCKCDYNWEWINE